MIILLLIIFIEVFTFFTILAFKKFSDSPKSNYESHSEGYQRCYIFSIVSGILILLFFIISFYMISEVSTEHVLDKKIEMYQEENHKIESNIDVVVSDFMAQEKDVFENFKTKENSIFLAGSIPELKSDSLVQKQIEIYTSNNEYIKKLRTEKLEILKTKWYLYFGK